MNRILVCQSCSEEMEVDISFGEDKDFFCFRCNEKMLMPGEVPEGADAASLALARAIRGQGRSETLNYMLFFGPLTIFCTVLGILWMGLSVKLFSMGEGVVWSVPTTWDMLGFSLVFFLSYSLTKLIFLVLRRTPPVQLFRIW